MHTAFRDIRIRNFASILVAMLIVIGAAGIFVSASTLQGISGIAQTSEALSAGPGTKIAALGDLRRSLGYDRTIHQFKNFILRKDRMRLVKIQESLLDVTISLAKYQTLGVTAGEKKAIADLDTVLTQYADATAVVEKMMSEGASSEEIDKAIRINDAPAVAALKVLQQELVTVREINARKMAQSIKRVSYIVITTQMGVAALLIIILLGTLWFVRWKLLSPLTRLGDVMQRLAAGNRSVEVPIADRGDELGDMARVVQVFKDSLIALDTEMVRREQAEEEVRALNQDLERRVDERTSELEGAQRSLAQKERLAALGHLTGTVAHELRNPLGSIATSFEVVQHKCRDAGMDLERALKRGERNIKRCDKIITDLLDFTRARGMDTAPTVMDTWLKEFLDEHHIPPNVTLNFKSDTNDVCAMFDHGRLRRALVNLIDNACDAMTQDSGPSHHHPGGELTVTTRINGEKLEIEIADTGPGIPSDIMPKIFEPMFSTKSFGFGLGLPTVRQIMEQHGGGIEISSVHEEGTRALLWLPLSSQMAEAEALV